METVMAGWSAAVSPSDDRQLYISLQLPPSLKEKKKERKLESRNWANKKEACVPLLQHSARKAGPAVYS